MVANFDETMLQWGKSRTNVIVAADTKRAFVQEPELSMHVTFCVTIFADGTGEQALIILPLQCLPSDVDESDYPCFNWTGQKNGWIDGEIFNRHCREVIIPAFNRRRAKLGNPDAKGILFVDGHSSRLNDELMDEFRRNKVDVQVFVSHTSHLSQPLDLCVFSEFKKQLRSERGIKSNLSTAEKRKCLLMASHHAFQMTSVHKYIKTSFELAGIWPLNPNKILDSPAVKTSDEVILSQNSTEPKHKKKRKSISDVKLTAESAGRRAPPEQSPPPSAPQATPTTQFSSQTITTPTISTIIAARSIALLPVPIEERGAKPQTSVCSLCHKESTAVREMMVCYYCNKYCICLTCQFNTTAMTDHHRDEHGENGRSKRRYLAVSSNQMETD